MPEIVVRLQNPEELSRDEVLECQNIAYDAYRSTLLSADGAELSDGALRYMIPSVIMMHSVTSTLRLVNHWEMIRTSSIWK